jgi:hypothetical protein
MPRNNRLLSFVSSIALLALVAGCGGGPDLDKSKEAVKTALDKWKAGANPADLSADAITMSDPDWLASSKLLDYELKDASGQPQQGPRVVVKLNLQTKAGKKLNKEVAYEVRTEDGKTTIGRDAFHVEN